MNIRMVDGSCFLKYFVYMECHFLTFGPENKLCRVVNYKSGMAALNALECGQFRSIQHAKYSPNLQGTRLKTDLYQFLGRK